MLTVLLGLTGALTYGGADFFGGLAARRSSTLLTTAGVAIVGLVGLVIASVFVPAISSADAWLYGGASGIAGAIGIGLLYGSLAIGPMSILSPATAFISAIVPVSVGLYQGEGGEASFFIALALALVAIILVGFVPEKGALRPRPLGLLMAVGSGTSIGLTIVLIDRSPADSGLIPLLANRIVSTTVLLACIAVLMAFRVAPVSHPSATRCNKITLGVAHDRHCWRARCARQCCRHLRTPPRRFIRHLSAHCALPRRHNFLGQRGTQRAHRNSPMVWTISGARRQCTSGFLDQSELGNIRGLLVFKLSRNTCLLK